jgi:hypothetical protein
MPQSITFDFDDGTSEDKELPDEVYNLVVSDPNYAKVLHDQVQTAHFLGKKIDSTPFKYKRKVYDPRGGGMSMLLRDSEEEANRRNELAAGGITVGAGPFSKAEIGYFQGLSKDNPQEFAEFFIPKVKEKVDPDGNIDPRHLVMVGQDNRVRFLDLKSKANPGGTNRWTEFEGLPIDPFNALEIGLDAAGSISGATQARKAMLKPFKEAAWQAAGGAAGTTDAELIRLGLGKLHGINKEIDPEEVLGAVTKGAGSFAAGEFGYGVGHVFHKWQHPYFFNKDVAENFESGLAQGSSVTRDIREVQDRLAPGSKEFDPDVAQKSGEAALMDLRATLLSRGGGSSEMKTVARLRAKDTSNNRVLNQLLDDMTATPEVSALEVGQATQTALEQQIKNSPAGVERDKLIALWNENLKKQKVLRNVPETNEKGRGSLIAAMQGSPTERIGEKITRPATGLTKVLEGYQEAEQKAWNGYESQLHEYEKASNNGQPMQVNIKEVLPSLGQYEKRAAEAWDKPGATRFSKVFQPILDAADKDGGFVTLSELNSNLSNMKETLRVASHNADQEGPAVGALQTAIGNLQKVRDNWITNVMRRPDIGDALLAAEHTTKQVHDLTNRSVASQMLRQTRDGEFVLTAPDTLMREVMVPGEDRGMKQWLEIGGHDPDIKQATKDWYAQDYANKVMKNGLADPRAHARWVRDNGPSARLLFDPQEMETINRLGGIGMLARAGKIKLKNAERMLKVSSAGKIVRMDPERIADGVLGVHSREGGAALRQGFLDYPNAASVVQTLKSQSPETFELLQGRAKTMIRNAMFGDEMTMNASKPLSSSTLGKFLEESQAKRLELVLGPQYVKDLRSLKQGLEIMERTGKANPIPMENAPMMGLRAIFGPLSRTQRLITTARRYSIIGQEGKLADIISDPNKLRKIMQVANMPANSPQFLSVAASVGVDFATQ